MTRVSVIMPCHNAGPWIREALQSAAHQLYPPHEVIVINDSSTDDSLAQIEASGVDVTLLHTDARNAAAARNRGIEVATGDWIAFLDADDVWYPHHLQKATELLDGSGDVAYMANHHHLYLDGRLKEIVLPPHPNLTQPTTSLTHYDFADLLEAGLYFGHSTVLIQRERLLQVGAFDETQKRRHDIDLWLRVLRNRTWAYSPEPASQYRVDTPGSISKNELECEFFNLRALKKNRADYQTEAMDALLERSAKKLISLSFTDAPYRDYRRARFAAWPHLTPAYRLFYRSAGLFPLLFQSGIKIKRHFMLWREQRSSMKRPAG